MVDQAVHQASAGEPEQDDPTARASGGQDFQDAPISDDDSTEFGEIVGDEEAQTPFELLRDKNLRNEVGGLLDVLDDREKKIIFQRFGLDGGKPKTLEEVGKKFGVTRERIRQLQNIALSKLRRALAKKERPVDVELSVEA